MKKLLAQIMRFGMVGFISFLIDYVLLLTLTEQAGINYLISSGISFTVSVVFNYLLSMRFVFESKRSSGKMGEFLLFAALSAVGLGLNQALMWFGVEHLHIPYQIAKIGVTGIVMVYNFITRKKILEK